MVLTEVYDGFSHTLQFSDLPWADYPERFPQTLLMPQQPLGFFLQPLMTMLHSSTAAIPPDEIGRQQIASSPEESLGDAIYHRLALVPLTITVTLFLLAFANPIQPQSDERIGMGNPILLLKLAVAGVAWLVGAWGVLHSPQIRRLLGSLPGIGTLLLAIVFLATSAFASGESAMISRAAALILLGYLFFVATALQVVGLRRICMAFLLGTCFYMIVTWSLYLFVPSIGEFHEYTDATTTVARMGGLAHPNSIARETGIALIICLALIRARPADKSTESQMTLRQWWLAQTRLGQLVWISVVALCVATLLTTLSRTSMLAAAAGIAMVLFDKLYTRRLLIAGIAGLVLIASAFILTALLTRDEFSTSATNALTKSGDVEELTSLTGRTVIWQEALSWISERPLTGYGMDSAASVMSKEAVGTHSLLLHTLFSGGVVAGLLMVLLLALTFYVALASPEPLFRGIATYVLVSGLVEDTLFSSFPCPITLLWATMIMSLALPAAMRSLRPAC